MNKEDIPSPTPWLLEKLQQMEETIDISELWRANSQEEISHGSLVIHRILDKLRTLTRPKLCLMRNENMNKVSLDLWDNIVSWFLMEHWSHSEDENQRRERKKRLELEGLLIEFERALFKSS